MDIKSEAYDPLFSPKEDLKLSKKKPAVILKESNSRQKVTRKFRDKSVENNDKKLDE